MLSNWRLLTWRWNPLNVLCEIITVSMMLTAPRGDQVCRQYWLCFFLMTLWNTPRHVLACTRGLHRPGADNAQTPFATINKTYMTFFCIYDIFSSRPSRIFWSVFGNGHLSNISCNTATRAREWFKWPRRFFCVHRCTRDRTLGYT